MSQQEAFDHKLSYEIERTNAGRCARRCSDVLWPPAPCFCHRCVSLPSPHYSLGSLGGLAWTREGTSGGSWSTWRARVPSRVVRHLPNPQVCRGLVRTVPRETLIFRLLPPSPAPSLFPSPLPRASRPAHITDGPLSGLLAVWLGCQLAGKLAGRWLPASRHLCFTFVSCACAPQPPQPPQPPLPPPSRLSREGDVAHQGQVRQEAVAAG